MFNPYLHAAQAACEEGDFSYGTSTTTNKPQDLPSRRQASGASGRQQQDACLWNTDKVYEGRQRPLDVDQETG